MTENPIAGLSLYHLDTELTSLLEYRTAMMEDDPRPTEKEVDAIDGEIRAYMAALPKKVDSVAHVIAHMQSQVNLAKAEIGQISARQRRFEEDIKRLKNYATEILEKQPEPKRGPKTLVGITATLVLKGNGGLAPLVIDNPSLVPPEYCRLEGWIREDVWQWLMDLGRKDFRKDCPSPNWMAPGATFGLARVPNNELIRRGIEESNGVPGAHLESRGKHLEIR